METKGRWESGDLVKGGTDGGLPKVPHWTLRRQRLEDNFGKPLDALYLSPPEAY